LFLENNEIPSLERADAFVKKLFKNLPHTKPILMSAFTIVKEKQYPMK
jgi:hypothetical protein